MAESNRYVGSRVGTCFEKKKRGGVLRAYLKIHNLSLSLHVFIIKPPYSPECSNRIEARERPILAYPVTTQSLI